MSTSTEQAAQTLEQRALVKGADLVLEGGGVKGIALVGALSAMADAGYVFPRVAGTSAGAIVAALVAAYQVTDTPLSQIENDMREIDYGKFMDKNWEEKHLGLAGMAYSLTKDQGLYSGDYLVEWLGARLDKVGITTFGQLRIDDDPGTGLPPQRRYRLVVHTSDLSRGVLVRLPWDLPWYLLPEGAEPTDDQAIAVMNNYKIVDAVRASMSIPFFFSPVRQDSPEGCCTWVDGGMLSNFPITVFDRHDGLPGRWPTIGVKLSAADPAVVPDKAVHGDVGELLAIAHTALGQWDRYPLTDLDVAARTICIDTFGTASTDFHLAPAVQDHLFQNGTTAAEAFVGAQRSPGLQS